MENFSAGRDGWTERHIGEMATPYTSSLPVPEREMVLQRVGRRLGERSLPDSRLIQIIMEETRFVEACM